MMKPLMVLPSDIPWQNLQGRDLEEALYWLFDAMGAQNLEWRIGGAGDGASDGGRDLEFTFVIPCPDGEIRTERWWVEAKGRKRTVESNAVKAAVINAESRRDLDVILICTNSTFSNPITDWAKEWQRNRVRPRVQLWDRTNLERLFTKYPEVAVRIFPEALTAQGNLEVVSARFWRQSFYSPQAILDQLWRARIKLEWNDKSRLAVLVSEMANGDILKRPWYMGYSKKQQLNLLRVALLNVIPFCERADRAGFEQFPLFKGVALLISLQVRKSSASAVIKFVNQVWRSTAGSQYTDDDRQMVMTAILDQLIREFLDACTSDCQRISTDPIELTDQEIANYWKRFTISPRGEDLEQERLFVIFESHKKPCNVGFTMDREHGCPLLSLNRKKHVRLDEVLLPIEKVLKFRAPIN
jgi:hypothetical protein